MGQNDPIQSTPSAPLTSIHYADSSCDAYKETIQKEMDKAFMIADDTARDPTYGDYYEVRKYIRLAVYYRYVGS